MAPIFLNYRRDDTAGYGQGIYDRLADHFGAAAIFMDVESIQPGIDFATCIASEIEQCKVLLVVIGKQWLTVTGEFNRRRIDEPNDWVRIEIAEALGRNIPIIPLLVHGATMPPAAALTDNIQALARRNAFKLSDDNFHRDMDDLIAWLEIILAPSAERTALLTKPSVTAGAMGAKIELLELAQLFDFRLDELSLNRQHRLSAFQRRRVLVTQMGYLIRPVVLGFAGIIGGLHILFDPEFPGVLKVMFGFLAILGFLLLLLVIEAILSPTILTREGKLEMSAHNHILVDGCKIQSFSSRSIANRELPTNRSIYRVYYADIQFSKPRKFFLLSVEPVYESSEEDHSIMNP